VKQSKPYKTMAGALTLRGAINIPTSATRNRRLSSEEMAAEIKRVLKEKPLTETGLIVVLRSSGFRVSDAALAGATGKLVREGSITVRRARATRGKGSGRTYALKEA